MTYNIESKVKQDMDWNKLRSLLLKKRVLIPALAVLLVFAVRIDLSGTPDPAVQRERISAYIDHFEPRGMTPAEHDRLVDAIMEAGAEMEIPSTMRIDGRRIVGSYLIAAYIRVESSFQRRARSISDARGYMQLKPVTARWINSVGQRRYTAAQVNLWDTEVNVDLGAEYISYLMTEMVDARKVALAYNAGPNSVRRGIYIEDYWEKILHTYRQLRTGEFTEEGVRL